MAATIMAVTTVAKEVIGVVLSRELGSLRTSASGDYYCGEIFHGSIYS